MAKVTTLFLISIGDNDESVISPCDLQLAMCTASMSEMS